MAADAPAWLREAFRDGVDDREMVYRDGVERARKKGAPYRAANPWCWLAQFDPKRLPCAGQDGHLIERFHFLRRQTVEDVVGRQLLACGLCDFGKLEIPGEGQATCPPCGGRGIPGRLRAELILLAAWDARNGGLACEHHHRRYDNHACSPSAPAIEVPFHRVPDHVFDFTWHWGLEDLFEDAFGQRLIGLDEPQPRPDR